MNYNEDTLTSKERKTIDDSQFGLPEERKYPLTDAAHVKSAMAYFRYCDADKKHALAKRILKAAKKYDVKVSEDSAVYKAAHEDADFMYTMNEEYYDNSRIILEADDDDFTNMLEDDDDDKKKKKKIRIMKNLKTSLISQTQKMIMILLLQTKQIKMQNQTL